MFSFKSLFHQEKAKPMYIAGTWFKIKDEYYEDTSSSRRLDTFIRLEHDIYDRKFSSSATIRYINICSDGKMYASTFDWVYTVHKEVLVDKYEEVTDEDLIKLLNCLISKNLERLKKEKAERVSKNKKTIEVAIKKTKCVEKS